MAYLWIELTKGLMPGNDRLLGNSPTDDELKNAELCAICQNEFVAPIKVLFNLLLIRMSGNKIKFS